MSADRAAAMRRGLALAQWTTSDLRIAALGLGGAFTEADVEGIVSGAHTATPIEYDILAAALHDRMLGVEHDRVVPHLRTVVG